MSSPDGAGYVVYPTMNRGGLVVFRADTGARYTTFLAGPGSIISGASVANNTLYIGGCTAIGHPCAQPAQVCMVCACISFILAVSPW